MEDVEIKLKKHNKILFNRQSECLQELITEIRTKTHLELVKWAFECVNQILSEFENQVQDERPRLAVDLGYQWAKGKIKMPVAKKTILECHALAKDLDDPILIALCHAIGQGISTVHVETHAIGFVFYELTAIVLKDTAHYEERVLERIDEYMEILKNIHVDRNEKWAHFLMKTAENKEDLLWKKDSNRLYKVK